MPVVIGERTEVLSNDDALGKLLTALAKQYCEDEPVEEQVLWKSSVLVTDWSCLHDFGLSEEEAEAISQDLGMPIGLDEDFGVVIRRMTEGAK